MRPRSCCIHRAALSAVRVFRWRSTAGVGPFASESAAAGGAVLKDNKINPVSQFCEEDLGKGRCIGTVKQRGRVFRCLRDRKGRSFVAVVKPDGRMGECRADGKEKLRRRAAQSGSVIPRPPRSCLSRPRRRDKPNHRESLRTGYPERSRPRGLLLRDRRSSRIRCICTFS